MVNASFELSTAVMIYEWIHMSDFRDFFEKIYENGYS